MYTLEKLRGQDEIPLGQEGVTQIELGVGDRLVVAPLPGGLGTAPVEIDGGIQVTALQVQPAERVQHAVAHDFFAGFFADDQPLFQNRDRIVVLSPTGQRETVLPQAPEEREQEAVLTRQPQRLRLVTRRLAVVAFPVQEVSPKGLRQDQVRDVIRPFADRHGLHHLFAALIETRGHGMDETRREVRVRDERLGADRAGDANGVPAVIDRAVELMAEGGGEAHRGERRRLTHAVTQLAGDGERLRTGRLRPLEVAQDDVETRDRLVNRHGEGAINGPRLAPARLQRLLVERHRFAVREGVGRLLGGLHEVLQRLPGVFRLRKVIREHLILLGEALGIEFLDRPRDDAMQLLASLPQKRVVGDLMGQGMLEHVRELGEERLLVDQLDGLQIPQELLRALADVADPVKEAPGELAPDDRRELERLLGGVGEPVDARHDDVLNRVGDDDLVEAGAEHVAVIHAPNGAKLLQRLDDLLNKERIALRLPHDEGPQVLRQIARAERGVRHLYAVLVRERREGNARVIAVLAEGMPVAGSVGEDVENPVCRNAVGGEEEAFLARLVDPVQVFMDQDLRSHGRGPHEEAAEGVEDLAATLLRVHRRDRGIAGIDGQEVIEVGQERPEILPEQDDAALDLPRDRPFRVAFLDAEVSFQHVGNWMKGDRLSEGHTAAFHPGCLVPNPPPELVQETGFADSRLTDDEHRLPLTSLRLLEALQQELELALAADIGREASLGAHVETSPRLLRGDDLEGEEWFRLPLDA